MYNKLFTKILDSSIWLEPTPTRIVWLTLIAGMDEDGFVALASVANLAHRARVELSEATEAVKILEAPDENSSDPDNEGRRIERVTGGWMVLNAPKYRDLVTRTVSREQTRIRVARYREKKNGNAPCNGDVTHGNGDVPKCNGSVTPSEAVTEAKKKAPAAPERSEDGKKFADWFKTLLDPSANLADNWRTEWADCYDQMLRLDKRTKDEVKAVCTWGRADAFWKSNFQTPLKLRKRNPDRVQYFDVIAEKMRTDNGPSNVTPMKAPTPDPSGWREWLVAKQFDYTPHSGAESHWRDAFKRESEAA